MINFSIFLPVRNGWPYIEECVESILNQSYPHFELIVLDNASIDKTVEYLSSLSDPRIRIVYSERSLSIVESWARIKNQPKLAFMTMIGHDDLFDPNYLEVISQLIENNPDASLYQTGSRLINDKGKKIRSCHRVPTREDAAGYLKSRFLFERDVFGTGYVMRSVDYDQVGGIYGFERLFFADDALWLSLSKKSWKAADPVEAFSVRIHPRSESASLPSAWEPILKGLNQFLDFVDGFVKEDEKSNLVYRNFGSDFVLKYHRNVYIYALVEASAKGRKIDCETIESIEASLAKVRPFEIGRINDSMKVKLIETLNASFCRGSVNYMWKIYNMLKMKSI